jgi:hypothetical protein
LTTTALPSASAGAMARIERTMGTLNGAMTPTTPTGNRRAKLSLGNGVLRTSPKGSEHSPAAS